MGSVLVRAMSKGISEEVTSEVRSEGRIGFTKWGRKVKAFQAERAACV